MNPQVDKPLPKSLVIQAATALLAAFLTRLFAKSLPGPLAAELATGSADEIIGVAAVALWGLVVWGRARLRTVTLGKVPPLALLALCVAPFVGCAPAPLQVTLHVIRLTDGDFGLVRHDLLCKSHDKPPTQGCDPATWHLKGIPQE